mmetsp:Transcript_2245/g.1565  ORF Transcript_2245/g.1565 Transcript_2245/m.1565 type:complete len:99 (+) Transcript_2245:1231-1527(+)
MKTYEGDAEDLMLTFSITDENEVTGEKNDIDLVTNGSEVAVNNQNKFRYIYLMADFRLNKRIKRQSDAFVAGFHELIPKQWLSIFTEQEVQRLISGTK